MIECIIGGSLLAAYVWSRPDKRSDELVTELEDLRDLIGICSKKPEKFLIHQSLITRDLQSLHGRLRSDDKLYEMLKILQKEWNDLKETHRFHREREIEFTQTNSTAYYL